LERYRLTSREKIGQLFMVGFLGTSVTPDLTSFIKEYKPGGVILFSRNLESVEQMVDLTNGLQACSPHSPLLISMIKKVVGSPVCRRALRFFPPATCWAAATQPNWRTRLRPPLPKS